MKKLYIIDTPKEIPCLGNIHGPLTTPTEIPFADVLELVRSRFDVYQVNAFDSSEKVKVTTENITKINFTTTRADLIAKRALNKSIQEMDSAMKIDIVTKDHDQNDKKDDNKKTSNKSTEKINKPDAFTSK